MAKAKKKEKRVNVDLGDLRRSVNARCKQLEITLQEGVRRACEQWVALGEQQ